MSQSPTAKRYSVEPVRNADAEYGVGDETSTGFDAFLVVDEAGLVLFDTLNRDGRLSEIHTEHEDDELGGRYYAWDEPAHRDLKIACEALNVHATTGMSPRQLADEVNSQKNRANRLSDELHVLRQWSRIVVSLKPGRALSSDDIECLKNAYYTNCAEEFVSEDGLRAVADAHLSISQEASTRLDELIQERDRLASSCVDARGKIFELSDERDRLAERCAALEKDTALHSFAEKRWALIPEREGGWLVLTYSEPDAEGVQSETFIATGATAQEAIAAALSKTTEGGRS